MRSIDTPLVKKFRILFNDDTFIDTNGPLDAFRPDNNGGKNPILALTKANRILCYKEEDYEWVDYEWRDYERR